MKKTYQSNVGNCFGPWRKHNAYTSLVFVCILFLSACATFQPQTGKEAFSRSRAVTKRDGNIRVTAAVLSPEETKAFFDLDLYDKGIQPIWLEIENNDDEVGLRKALEDLPCCTTDEEGKSKLAFVKGVGAATIMNPRFNLTGDPYFTDGLRAVLWVSSDPVDLEEIAFLEWEIP